MRNKVISVLLAAVMFSTFSLSAFASGKTDENEETVVIHMSLNPDKQDNRHIDSLEDLRFVLPSLDASVKNIVVEVDGGTYHITKGFVIDKALTGDRKLTIKAKHGEKPVFSGAKSVDISKFKAVEDKDMLSRLNPRVVANIGQIDLGELGFTREELDFTSGHTVGQSLFPIGIFLNDSKESLARFPNSSYNVFDNVIDGGGTARWGTRLGQGASFQVSQSNVRNWGKASETAWLEGYFGVEYFSEWAKVDSIEPATGIINLKKETQYGVKIKHKWAISNLPEEIDVPGEWYIDFETLNMYYYPRYPLNVNADTLEIAFCEEPLIKLDGVSNVDLVGLSLKNSSSDGIDILNCTDVKVLECSLYNLVGKGIYMKNVTSTRICGCTINETQDVGIYLQSGGDRMLLKSNECVISNNHICRTGLGASSNWDGGIEVGHNTVGTLIENNLIHGVKNYSIAFGGNDTTLRYNEIWSGNRETADSIPIYNGRRLSEYGTLIEYNYLHDCFNSTENLYGNHGITTGDDNQAGTTIRHNIIRMTTDTPGTTYALGAGNRDGCVDYNIVVDAKIGLNLGDGSRRTGNLFESTVDSIKFLLSTMNVDEGLEEGYAFTPIWLEKYPQVSWTYDEIVAAGNVLTPTQRSTCTNNIFANAPTKIEDVMYEKMKIENNFETDGYDIFVDPDNHDFRISSEAMKKYGFDKNVLNEENFNMDSIGIQESEFEVETPDSEFMKLYPKNGDKYLQRENLEILWERATFADEYEYIVAKDPELTDVVMQGTTIHNSVVLEGLENNTVYYWNVKAKNLSKQIGNEWWSVGSPYVFKTSKTDDLDMTILNSLISEAEELAATITEGDKIDDFAKGTIENLNFEIAEAKKIAAITVGTSDIVNDAVERLRSYISLIDSWKIKGHIGLDVDQSKWGYMNEEKGEWVFDGSEIGASAAANSLVYLEKIPNNRILHFKVKSDFMNWFGLGIKQKDMTALPFSQANTDYCIIIKPDLFELQKYNPLAKTTGILKTEPNNGILPENEWVDIEFGAINVNGGVEVRFVVNGEVIFDYYDNIEPCTEEGYFVLVPSYSGGWTYIKPADNVPESVFIPNGSLFDHGTELVVKSTYFTPKDTFYSESGEFSEMPAKGYESDTVRVTTGGTAVWDTKTTMGEYKFYYWHTPIANGDKKAKIVFDTLMGISGSFTFEKTVDFSSGEPGWREIGTFLASSPDATTGIVTMKIIGSGEGQVPVSAIRMDEARAGELDFSKLFYSENKNMMAMKIGKTRYFNNIASYDFDVAPEITQNRTFVPIRSIAEGFGFDVEYEQVNRTVSLRKNGTEVVFTIGQENYFVNGEEKSLDAAPYIKNDRTLLPIRAISEAIGKTVYWDEDRQLILIGDKISVTDSTKNTYSNSLNMLSEAIDK